MQVSYWMDGIHVFTQEISYKGGLGLLELTGKPKSLQMEAIESMFNWQQGLPARVVVN